MPTRSSKALGEILPGFWIGRMAAVRAIFDMPQEEWTVVSLLSSETMIRTLKETLQEEERKFGKKKRERQLVTQHVVWDMPDKAHAPFVSSKLAEVVQTIDQSLLASHNVLVHCARGVSRSAAVCAAYLISRRQYTLQTAMEQIQKARPVNPNLGFLAGLRAIEKCNGDIDKAEQRLQRKHAQISSNGKALSKMDQGKTLPKKETKANKLRGEQQENGAEKGDQSLERAPKEGKHSDEVSC